MANNNNKITLAILGQRVGVLEKSVSELENRVEELLINHLPHLQSQVASLQTRVTVLAGLNIGAVILGVLIAKYL